MVNKREYNSDRRRKSISFCLSDIFLLIRENITPIGDGNPRLFNFQCPFNYNIIRENITPIGDGNIIHSD